VKPSSTPWRILAIAIVTSILTGPGQTIGVSVFIDPMVAALGVSRSAVSAAYLVGTLIGAAAMPRFGRFVDANGVRRSQLLVGGGFALALVNMAAVTNLIWLAVGFAGIRLLGQGALSMVTTVTVSVWFERRRGLAMGLMATVAGAGMVCVPVVLNAGISATSWRVTWLLTAGVVLATVIPLGHFGLIDRPADVGLAPDGMPIGAGAGAEGTGLSPDGDRHQHDTVGYTRAEALRTRQFWIVGSVTAITGMLITGLNFHQIDLLAEVGLSSGEAAAMFLPQILGASVLGLGAGYLMDRFGNRFAPAVAMALLVAVHALAITMGPGGGIVVYAIALGATGGATRAVVSTILPAYFGTDHIGSIQGMMTVLGVAGSALGPVTLAVVEAWLGSYRAANTALVIVPILVLGYTMTNRRLPTRVLVPSYG
jgi:MFS family permease